MPPGRMISTPKLWQHPGGTFNSVLGSLQMAPSCKHTIAETSNCTPSNEASGPRVQAVLLSYMGSTAARTVPIAWLARYLDCKAQKQLLALS